MEINPVLAGEEQCICKRSAQRTHCPYCGRANFYALKDKISRPHPQTGIMTEATLFRCRGCNKQFDDLQWRFNCEAPTPIRTQHETARALVKEELFARARIPGIKFDENEKRHFRKVTGMQYDEYRELMGKVEKRIHKAEFIGTTSDTQKLIGANKLKIVLDDKHAPKISPELTPYQAHLEQCQTCMIADKIEDHCEVGKTLFVLTGKKK